MAMQRVEIELPEAIYRQLSRIAKETGEPIAALVAQSAISNLPPSADRASPEMRTELLRLQSLGTEELLSVANSQIIEPDRSRHIELLAKNQDDLLTDMERQELSGLGDAADNLMLLKAYAWSVLRWRGQRIPALQELAAPQ